ncbi:hypothetical protein WJX72_001492 [[Myrmecia] bisecta]|uniref:GHMP kinase N-terminal domain-containing protein n=1 Tax=[Myrmecia] bisecta TaxID=41462 RepID=A0AAW1PF29_9CHLO
MEPLAGPDTVTERVYARIGLLGNPSDGFFGKTISLSLQNFYAEVRCQPSAAVCFLPHPVHDSCQFTSLTSLVSRVQGQGYYGGLRLLMAACKRFYEYCQQRAIPLPETGFTLSYDTNIPRQTGLSGSSAIVCAALNCLMKLHGVGNSIPMIDRPALVLSAEQELGITAGLQDRVIQVYGGVVYMDFDRKYMDAHGHGRYEPLDVSLVPPLWLVYAENPSDSGTVHSDVKRRWLDGDPEIYAGMAEVAELAVRGRQLLEQRDYHELAKAMDHTFNLRRRMFGDAVLGSINLRMIELARSAGGAAKFTGSGGAIVVMFPQGGEAKSEQLRQLCSAEGFTVVPVDIAPPCNES